MFAVTLEREGSVVVMPIRDADVTTGDEAVKRALGYLPMFEEDVAGFKVTNVVDEDGPVEYEVTHVVRKDGWVGWATRAR